MITMRDVERHIRRVLDDRRLDERWTRARPTCCGPDGVSTSEFFALPFRARLAEVQARLATGCFRPVRQVEIQRAGKAPRFVGVADRADQAILYGLADALSPLVESKLSRVAVGFRAGRPLDRTVCAFLEQVEDPHYMAGLHLDVAACFDWIAHDRLERLLVALDPEVKALVMAHASVAFVTQDGRVLRRVRGVPQGSPLAPVLANLYLDGVDRRVLHRTGQLRPYIRRYADDFVVLAPSVEDAQLVRTVVTEELQRVQLKAKEGTGAIVLLDDAATPLRWLGIAASRAVHRADEHALQRKVADYAAETAAGTISRDGLRERLEALHRYYMTVLSEPEADAAIGYIEERLDLRGLPAPAGRSPLTHIESQLRQARPIRVFEQCSEILNGNEAHGDHTDRREAAHHPEEESGGNARSDGQDTLRAVHRGSTSSIGSGGEEGAPLGAARSRKSAREPLARSLAGHTPVIGNSFKITTETARRSAVVTVSEGTRSRTATFSFGDSHSLVETELRALARGVAMAVDDGAAVVRVVVHHPLVRDYFTRCRARRPWLHRRLAEFMDVVGAVPEWVIEDRRGRVLVCSRHRVRRLDRGPVHDVPLA